MTQKDVGGGEKMGHKGPRRVWSLGKGVHGWGTEHRWGGKPSITLTNKAEKRGKTGKLPGGEKEIEIMEGYGIT